MKTIKDPLIVLPAYDFKGTMQAIERTIYEHSNQTNNTFFHYDHSTTIPQYCNWLWKWLRENVKYRLDSPLKEEIRTPNRTIADKGTGVDCEDFAIFISTILLNNAIPHCLRVADYGSGWAHIYVVAYPNTKKEIILDPVNSRFNVEKPFVAKKDYPIKPLAKGLRGIEVDGIKYPETWRGEAKIKYLTKYPPVTFKALSAYTGQREQYYLEVAKRALEDNTFYCAYQNEKGLYRSFQYEKEKWPDFMPVTIALIGVVGESIFVSHVSLKPLDEPQETKESAATDLKRDYKKYAVSKVPDFQFEYGVKPSNGNRYKFIYEIKENGLAYSTYSGNRKSSLSLLQIQGKEDLLDNIKFHLKLIEKGKRDCEESARIVREGVSVAYGRGLSSNEIREFWEVFDMTAESLFSETESLKILQQMAAESNEAPKEGAQFKAKQPKEAPKANPPKQSGKFNVNQEIERLLDSQTAFSEAQLQYLKNYSGSGGKAKDGATGEGLLYEFYTPDQIAALMWEIAVAHGYDGGNVLETSCGTGVFFDTAPDKEAKYVGFEINPYSAKIAQLRHPKANIYNLYFEMAFLDPIARYRSKFKGGLTWLAEYPFDIVIGNPPYGIYQNQYSPYFPELKKKGIRQIEMAFMYWSLQMLKPKGLMVYITSQNFMRTGIAYQSSKELLGEMAEFVDAYRLPSVFDSSQVPTDILVFRKK